VRKFRKFIENCGRVLLLLGFVAVISYGQSLGDIAREQRQKQQAKKAQADKKVVTNEDIPQHPDTEQTTSSNSQMVASDEDLAEKKPPEQWKQEIQAQKQSVANLQAEMDRLNSSIHFAPGNCVRNCVQHNEHQVEKQDEVQRMQAELEEQKKKLEDMQESARKQGYGNSVYEP
jgi:predicted RNase H-like nuclease (RuvC/YqgF family)